MDGAHRQANCRGGKWSFGLLLFRAAATVTAVGGGLKACCAVRAVSCVQWKSVRALRAGCSMVRVRECSVVVLLVFARVWRRTKELRPTAEVRRSRARGRHTQLPCSFRLSVCLCLSVQGALGCTLTEQILSRHAQCTKLCRSCSRCQRRYVNHSVRALDRRCLHARLRWTSHRPTAPPPAHFSFITLPDARVAPFRLLEAPPPAARRLDMSTFGASSEASPAVAVASARRTSLHMTPDLAEA